MGRTWDVKYDPAGMVVTAGADGTIKRTKLPLPAARSFAGHGQAVRAIVTTADGRGAFSAGLDVAIAAVSLETVNAALRRHLRPERLLQVYAGDFAKSGVQAIAP